MEMANSCVHFTFDVKRKLLQSVLYFGTDNEQETSFIELS